jgi:hypothetical protein
MESRMKVLLEKAHDPFDTKAIKKYIAEQSKTRLRR